MKYLGNRNLSKSRNRGGHLKKSHKKKREDPVHKKQLQKIKSRKTKNLKQSGGRHGKISSIYVIDNPGVEKLIRNQYEKPEEYEDPSFLNTLQKKIIK